MPLPFHNVFCHLSQSIACVGQHALYRFSFECQPATAACPPFAGLIAVVYFADVLGQHADHEASGVHRSTSALNAERGAWAAIIVFLGKQLQLPAGALLPQ